MNTKNSIVRTLGRGLASVLAMVLMFAVAFGQNVRNGGTIINKSTMNVKNFNNAKNSSPGTLKNAATINLTSNGSFYNYDSIGAGSANGTFYNFGAGSASGAGSLNGALNFDNRGGTTNNDTSSAIRPLIQVAVQVKNTVGTITTTVGTFEFNGSGSQALPAATIVPTYGNLKVSNTGTKSLGTGNVAVNNQVDLGASTTLNVNGQQLTLNGTTPFTGTGVFDGSTTSSTTIYNASGSQQVRNSTYYNLKVQNTGQKTAQGAIALTAGGLLTVNASTDSLDLQAFWFSDSSTAAITNNGKIKTAGGVAFNAAPPTIGGSFIYYGTAAQNLGGANYAGLTLLGAGTKTFPANIGVSGVYTVESSAGTRNYGTGTFAYNSTGAQTVAAEAYHHLTVTTSADTSLGNAKTAAGAIVLSGDLSISSTTTFDMGSFAATTTFGAGSANSGRIRWSGDNVHVGGTGITEMYGATAGNLIAGNYGNLWFTGSGAKTISAGTVNATLGTFTAIGVTVSDNLTVGGTLHVTSMDLNIDGVLTNNGTVTVD